jgi:hypothetical protein
MDVNYFGLLDASQLLQLFRAFILLLVGIVALGIAVELIGLLLMWLVESEPRPYATARGPFNRPAV